MAKVKQGGRLERVDVLKNKNWHKLGATEVKAASGTHLWSEAGQYDCHGEGGDL